MARLVKSIVGGNGYEEEGSFVAQVYLDNGDLALQHLCLHYGYEESSRVIQILARGVTAQQFVQFAVRWLEQHPRKVIERKAVVNENIIYSHDDDGNPVYREQIVEVAENDWHAYTDDLSSSFYIDDATKMVSYNLWFNDSKVLENLMLDFAKTC